MLPLVLLAGGRGTRIASAFPDVPKPMAPVLGRPFLDWKLAGVAAEGISEVILLVAHRSEVMVDHLPALQRTGLEIRVIDEGGDPLGTAGALRAALSTLPELFLLGYADSFLTSSHADLARHHLAGTAPATLAVVRHDDAAQPGNTQVVDGMVVGYEKGTVPGRFPFLDYGQMALERDLLDLLPDGFTGDLSVLFGELARRRLLAAFEVQGRFFDINTPAALADTEAAFEALALGDRLAGYLP